MLTLGYLLLRIGNALQLLNAINPFDQPGAEAYKKKYVCPFLQILRFEELGAELNARLNQ